MELNRQLGTLKLKLHFHQFYGFVFIQYTVAFTVVLSTCRYQNSHSTQAYFAYHNAFQ